MKFTTALLVLCALFALVAGEPRFRWRLPSSRASNGDRDRSSSGDRDRLSNDRSSGDRLSRDDRMVSDDRSDRLSGDDRSTRATRDTSMVRDRPVSDEDSARRANDMELDGSVNDDIIFNNRGIPDIAVLPPNAEYDVNEPTVSRRSLEEPRSRRDSDLSRDRDSDLYRDRESAVYRDRDSDRLRDRDSDRFRDRDSDSYRDRDSDRFRDRDSDSYRDRDSDSYRDRDSDRFRDRDSSTAPVTDRSRMNNQALPVTDRNSGDVGLEDDSNFGRSGYNPSLSSPHLNTHINTNANRGSVTQPDYAPIPNTPSMTAIYWSGLSQPVFVDRSPEGIAMRIDFLTRRSRDF